MKVSDLINEVQLSKAQEKSRIVFNRVFDYIEKQSNADKVWDFLEKEANITSTNRRTEDLEEILFDIPFRTVEKIYKTLVK
jgi:outer membrane PBP1 activator LpoA protein